MYTLSYYYGTHRSFYDVVVASSAVSLFAYWLSDGDDSYHHHSLFRNGRLVARQVSYQGF